jgi:hypothetical protein
MTSKRPDNLAIRAASALMLALWVATFVLAVSPQLHSRLHSDAQNLSHRCLISQVQQQGVLSGVTPAITAALAPPGPELVLRADPQFFPSSDYRFSPSRAPPVSNSSITVAG